MQEDLVEQVYILDRSGSMASRITDVIGGFNKLIQQQRELPGRCNVTVVVFDADYSDWCVTLHAGCDVRSLEPLTEKAYFARGGTALRDAIGQTIDAVGRRMAGLPEHQRPRKVTVSIFSDGEENSSKEYSSERVKGMIEHQKSKYNWEFTFVGTNQNAILEAGSYGIGAGSAINFSPTAAGFAGGIRAMNNYMSSSRLSPAGVASTYSLSDRVDAAAGEIDIGVDQTAADVPDAVSKTTP